APTQRIPTRGASAMRPTRFPALLLATTVLLGGLRAAEPLPPTAMPRDHAGPRPQPRAAAEAEAGLAGAPNPPEKPPPGPGVPVAGKKDHGKGEHDYPAWQKAWAALFALADRTEVATAWEWPAPEEFRKADVMVFYQHGDWTPERAADVDAFLERGGGLVY